MFSFPKIQFEKAFPDGDKSIYSTKSCEKPLLEDLPPPLVFDERNDFYWTRHPDGEGEIGCLRTCCWREPAFPESILWFIRILRPTDSLLHEMDQFKKANDWWSYQWVQTSLVHFPMHSRSVFISEDRITWIRCAGLSNCKPWKSLKAGLT